MEIEIETHLGAEEIVIGHRLVLKVVAPSCTAYYLHVKDIGHIGVGSEELE